MVLAPISDSLAPSNPGDYPPPQTIGDWGHQSRPDPQASDPFYPDGCWGYLKGNGARL